MHIDVIRNEAFQILFQQLHSSCEAVLKLWFYYIHYDARSCELYTFCDVLHEIKQIRKQTLERAQYGLEIIFNIKRTYGILKHVRKSGVTIRNVCAVLRQCS